MALDSFAPYMPTLMKMVVEHLFKTKAAKCVAPSSLICTGVHGYMPDCRFISLVAALVARVCCRLARLFTHTSAILMGFHGGAVFEQLMEAIQPGLTVQIASNVLAAMGRTVSAE